MESAIVPSQSKRYALNDPAGNCNFNAGLLSGFELRVASPHTQRMLRSSRCRRSPWSDADGEAFFCAGDRTIERVALEWLAAGLADEPYQVAAAHALRRARASIVVDLLFNHRAVDIIRTKAQRDLSDARGHHLPVRLDVRKVVQQQAAYGDLP